MLAINPVGGTIAALRSAILGTPILYQDWFISTTIGLIALIVGLIYFQRVEKRFADIV